MSTAFDQYKLQYSPEWRLEHQIGRGGFGAVYKEHIRRPGMFKPELCAVKKILLGAVDLAGDLQRYKTEIAILASLVHHEWFVQFVGWCEDKEFVFIAMEYMELGDLGRHIGTPWSEGDTKIVAEQLLKGLTVLHKAGVAHRDLKPENVFPILLDDGSLRIKIGDFGVSKSVASTVNTSLRTLISVPGYTAPEMIAQSGNYTNAVDLWSLGCLVYRMICGEDLFCSFQDVFYYKINALAFPRDRLSALGLSHNGIDFIESLLQKDAQHRPTAEDVLTSTWIGSEPLEYKVSPSLVERFQNHVQPHGHAIPDDAASQVKRFQNQVKPRRRSILNDAATVLPRRDSLNDAAAVLPRRDSEGSVLDNPPATHGNRTSLTADISSSELSRPTAVCRKTLVGHPSVVFSVAISPDGGRLASGSGDNTVKLWDPVTGICQETAKGVLNKFFSGAFSADRHSDYVYAVAFSPDGKCLASASRDRTIKLRDPSTGACLATLKRHSHPLLSIAFSPDGKHLATGGCDHNFMIGDSNTDACQVTLEGHSESVSAVAFSPDGKHLVSGSEDKTIKLWDLSIGACQATLAGHSSVVCSVAFSPDGKHIASSSYDKTIKIWNPSTGACQATLIAHSATVRSVVFSPDGRRLASGSGDNTVKLWDLSTGECQATLEGHSHSVYSIAFSPDGKHLASGSADSTIKLWYLFT